MPLTVTFPIGPAIASCINVIIVNDNELEGNHSFSVFISDPGPFAMTGTPDTTVITIEDDESKSVHLN